MSDSNQNEDKDLKPIQLSKPASSRHRKNKFQQNMLLKGLAETDDLEELKNIAQFKSKAGVLKTLDKMQMREEYHQALERHGLDLDSIVQNLAELANSSDEKIKMKSTFKLLKSLGLEKYEEHEEGKQNWEDIILQIEQEKRDQDEDQQSVPDKEDIVYDVNAPEKPEGIEEEEDIEEELGQSIYD